jgi:hypothetical protein
MTHYKVKYDIGPTSTTNVFGLPAIDGKIQFEDLVIFSISYGMSNNHLYPKISPIPDKPVEFTLGKQVTTGSETLVPLNLTGAVSDVRAISLSLSGQYGKFIGVEKGSLLNEYTTPVMLFSKNEENRVDVDLAVMGLDAKAINREGELLILRFEGNTNVSICKAEARNSGNLAMLTKLTGETELIPEAYSLKQNYPNPFNPTTVISYQLPVKNMVEIDVYNTIGEKVATLVNEVKEVGSYKVEWNAGNLTSGVYFYNINAGEFNAVRKMLLIK